MRDLCLSAIFYFIDSSNVQPYYRAVYALNFIFFRVSFCACMCVYMGLCVQYGDGKKRRKPNYSSVDLSEVEWEDKDDTVRRLL